MKKVLMISYYYPPIVDVGSLRTLGFSRYLPESGWEPYVLSVKNPDRSLCTVGSEKPPENINVIYARSLFNLNWITWKVNGLVKLILKIIGKKTRRNVVQDLTCIPDVFIGWIIPSFLKGLSLVKTQGIDVIYVSSKPFSSALTGVFLKKLTKLPLILDFRDPVSFPVTWKFEGIVGRYRLKIIRKMEKYAVKNTDMLLVTADETKEEYLSLYPFLRGKIERIYNGYYGETARDTEINSFEKFTITYTGDFYFEHIPSDSFFQALNIIIKNKLILREKFQFLYLGHLSGKDNWLKRTARKYAIEDIVVAPGGVSWEESYKTMTSSSLLYLKRHIPTLIPAKLYDYLATGVPILAIIDEGEKEGLIKKYSNNSYIITSNDVGDIVNSIVDAYDKWENGRLGRSVNRDYLKQFNKKTLTGEFVTVLEGIGSTQGTDRLIPLT